MSFLKFFRTAGEAKTTKPNAVADTDRPVFFLHIPKTAGTSFVSFLTGQFPKDRQIQFAYWERLRKRPIEELKQYQLITGHIGYDLSFYLENPFIITILRHPVDRICSIYEFLRELYEKEPDFSDLDPDINELVQLWKGIVRRPFEEFLDSPEAPARAALLDNPQARQLAQPSPYLFTDYSEEVLHQLAGSRLKKIDVVGCVDHFAETVELTCRKRRWPIPEDINRYSKNLTRNRSVRQGLSASVRKKIERMSAVDLQLYKMARSRIVMDLRKVS